MLLAYEEHFRFHENLKYQTAEMLVSQWTTFNPFFMMLKNGQTF